MKGLVQELRVSLVAVEMNCDSQSTIHLSKNQTFHERTKHTDMWLHFIIDVLLGDEVKVVKVATEDNVVDIITKSLSPSKFYPFLEFARRDR